jgi:hypothetical protein
MPFRRMLALALLIGFCAIAQDARSVDDPDPVFHDDLLDHLVGRWVIAGTVHGQSTQQALEAEWVLNHQFLRIHEKSVENVAGTNAPFEALYFIGYDIPKKRYVAHLIDVFGGEESEVLGYGERRGNVITLVFEYPDARIANQFTWLPTSKTWKIVNGPEDTSGESKPFMELTATPAK